MFVNTEYANISLLGLQCEPSSLVTDGRRHDLAHFLQETNSQLNSISYFPGLVKFLLVKCRFVSLKYSSSQFRLLQKQSACGRTSQVRNGALEASLAPTW
jgi:hypothetical protein